MKMKCANCGNKFVYNKKYRKFLISEGIIAKEENSCCDNCIKELAAIAYSQSYFGSISEWGPLPPGYDGT